MPKLNVLQATPDVSFIDGKTIDQVRGEMVADYEHSMSLATGTAFTLDRSSVHRMELYAAAAQIFQVMQYVDRAGKQNLLKYSYSDWLDNLALLKGVTRAPAAAATTTLRFAVSAVRGAATAIPQGTKVSAGGTVHFKTVQYAEVPSGSATVDVPAVCAATGTEGNGLAVGELSTLVNPLPYVARVTNITPSEGGVEIESDTDLAERVYLAPGAYSTAGPEDGYLYHARKYNSGVGDVVATSDQAAGTVDLVFIMADGGVPGQAMIEGLQSYLRDGNIRPMTDLVRVSVPAEVEYSIDLTYYINRSDSARAVAIQDAVKTAMADYTVWQRAIGRDVNPSKLVAMVMSAGAKRVTVSAPVYTTVAQNAVAALSTATIDYGGLEDD